MKLEKTHDAVIFWYRLTSVLTHLKEEATFFYLVVFLWKSVISLNFVVRQGDVASHTNPLTSWLRCWDSNAVRAVGEACEELISHGLKHSHTDDFWPRPPEKPPSSGKNVASSLPPFLSLPHSCPSPPRPLSWEIVKRGTVSLACVLCWLEFNFHMYTVSYTCTCVLQNMLYNGERSNCFSVCIEQILALRFVHIPHSNTGRILL